MKNKVIHNSKWRWYAVKNIFESTITGEPDADTIDSNYTNEYKTYEESIMLVRAQSFEHAYKLAEEKVKEAEIEYYNPYGQFVKCRYVDSIGCYLVDDTIKSGTEVYSRHFRMPKDTVTGDFIKTFYPETLLADADHKDYYYPFTIK